jgi:hypothetical protein
MKRSRGMRLGMEEALVASDTDEDIFVGVKVEKEKQRAGILGWLRGSEGKIPRFYQKNCWVIPAEALHDMEELPDKERFRAVSGSGPRARGSVHRNRHGARPATARLRRCRAAQRCVSAVPGGRQPARPAPERCDGRSLGRQCSTAWAGQYPPTPGPSLRIVGVPAPETNPHDRAFDYLII